MKLKQKFKKSVNHQKIFLIPIRYDLHDLLDDVSQKSIIGSKTPEEVSFENVELLRVS